MAYATVYPFGGAEEGDDLALVAVLAATGDKMKIQPPPQETYVIQNIFASDKIKYHWVTTSPSVDCPFREEEVDGEVGSLEFLKWTAHNGCYLELEHTGTADNNKVVVMGYRGK